MGKALLLIDIQNDYFAGGKSELYKPLCALNNVEKVLQAFREKNLPVIHVQHINTREGATFFLPDTEGAEIHQRIAPLENEHLVVKHAPNSFFETNLSDILLENRMNELIVCGMMSHMCVDTTVRACKDYGFQVTLLEDCCATKDLKIHDITIPAETVHNTFMASLNGMFAKVMKTSDFLLHIL